jgi:hypothetical protein
MRQVDLEATRRMFLRSLLINAMPLDLDPWDMLPFLSPGTTLHSLISKMYKNFFKRIYSNKHQNIFIIIASRKREIVLF